MFIVNKFTLTTPAPVVATNNNDAVTGNQSTLWGGIAPNSATGATGNAAAGQGLTNITTNAAYLGQAGAELYEITITGALTAGQINYIRIPFSSLNISGNKRVRVGWIIGIYDPNADELNNTPTPSYVAIQITGSLNVVKDALVVAIPAANVALYQNKILQIMVVY